MSENMHVLFLKDKYDDILQNLVLDNQHFSFGLHLMVTHLISINDHFCITKKVHVNFHNMTATDICIYHVHRLLTLIISKFDAESDVNKRVDMMHKLLSVTPVRGRISRVTFPILSIYHDW